MVIDKLWKLAGISVLLILFVSIACPVFAQEEKIAQEEKVAEDISEAKTLQEAIKKRIDHPVSGIAEELKRMTGQQVIKGKPYGIEKPPVDVAPAEKVIKGKDYVPEAEDKLPLARDGELIEGKKYISAPAREIRKITGTTTRGLIVGKDYPSFGFDDTKVGETTAAAAMGQLYTGKDYLSVTPTEYGGVPTPIKTTPAYMYMGGQQYGVQGAPTPDETMEMASNALGTATTMGIVGLSEIGKIFNIVINNTHILYTIIVCIFAAVIGKLAGWQIGLIGGSALAVTFTLFSDGGTTLMPAFITGIIVLGSAAMISMAVSKMTAG